jgi:hypothetical protein
VDIIGRESDHITFVRLSDGSRHRFPISNLSEESRAFIEQLPFVTPSPEIQNTSNSSREPGSLKFLRIRLKDLEVEIGKNVELRSSGIQSFVQQRTLASEYKRLMNERAKIISEISDLESW